MSTPILLELKIDQPYLLHLELAGEYEMVPTPPPPDEPPPPNELLPDEEPGGDDADAMALLKELPRSLLR